MARLVLVRHGEAAAGWDEDTDPGLSPLGRTQADDAAAALASLGPLPILVSPMRRTRETAAPLASRWGVEPIVEPRVSEIKAPTDDLDERTAWLRRVLSGSWSDLDEASRQWADDLVDLLLSVSSDAVIVTHFVAINVAIGRATGDDRVVVLRVGNCSRTVLTNDGGVLALLEAPAEITTEVL